MTAAASPSEVALAYVAALNAHDPDAVAACVAEGFANLHPGTGATSTQGRAAYRARLPTFFAQLVDLVYAIGDVHATGDHVTVDYTLSAHAQGPDGAWRPLCVPGRFELDVDPATGLLAQRVDTWDADEVARQLAPA